MNKEDKSEINRSIGKGVGLKILKSIEKLPNSINIKQRNTLSSTPPIPIPHNRIGDAANFAGSPPNSPIPPSILSSFDGKQGLRMASQTNQALMESEIPVSNSIENSIPFLERSIIVCERERCKSWISEYNLDILAEREVVTGFKLYAVEEWIYDPALLNWVLIEYTGFDEDKIVVTVLKPGASMTPSQRKYCESLFFRSINDGTRLKETPLGTIRIGDPSDFSNRYSLIPIPGGDYEKYFPSLIHQIILKRMSCGNQPISLGREPLASMEAKFYETYNVSGKEPIVQAREILVEEVQTCLHHLGLIPNSAQIDGHYSNVTMSGVMKFQRQLNATSPTKLPTNGYLTLETYRSLTSQVSSYKDKLDKLGFKCTSDPIKNPVAFSDCIKQFQRLRGIQADGRLSKATCSQIIKSIDSLKLSNSVPAPLPPKEPVTPDKTSSDPVERELMRKLSVLTMENVDPKDLKVKDLFKSIEAANNQLYGRSFVSCERDLCKSWATQNLVTIVSESEQLNGYKAKIVEEWVFDSSARMSIIEKTTDPNEKIKVTIVQPKSGISLAQENILKAYFLPSDKHFYTEETPIGTVILYKNDVPEPSNEKVHVENLSFVPIPDGEIDQLINNIKLQITLRRLGCGYYPTFIDDQNHYLSLMEHKLRSLYGLAPTVSLQTGVETVVKFIKGALANLKLLQPDSIDGVYDNKTAEVIKAFQISAGIKGTGHLNSTTLQVIAERITQLKITVQQAGFKCPVDPFKDYEEFGALLATYEKEKIQGRDLPSPRAKLRSSGSDTVSYNFYDLDGDSNSYKSKDAVIQEHLKKRIKDLEALIEKQGQTYKQLKSDYDNLEMNYSKLKEEAQEALAKAQLYRIQLTDLKKSFTRLNHEYSHTHEILREHHDTIRTYSSKISRLEDRVSIIQRSSKRNMFAIFLTTLLTWFLSLIAVIILVATTAVDSVKRFTGRGSTSSSATTKMKHFLLQQKHMLEDFEILERTSDRKDTPLNPTDNNSAQQ